MNNFSKHLLLKLLTVECAAPVFNGGPYAATAVPENSVVGYTVVIASITASDADGDTLTFTLSGKCTLYNPIQFNSFLLATPGRTKGTQLTCSGKKLFRTGLRIPGKFDLFWGVFVKSIFFKFQKEGFICLETQ